MEFTGIFLSLAALVAFVVLVTDAIIRVFKLEKKLHKQITAWSLSVGLSLVGYFMDQGMFAEISLVASALTGLAAGLAANGLYTVEKVQAVLDFLLQLLPKKVVK